jgi:hypothetical protein
MGVPHQYPYNPPLRLILLFFGTGFLWLAVDWYPYWLPGGHGPTGFKFWFSLVGLVPIAWSLILAVCRICAERYLLLDHDSMVLPVGLFAMRAANIEYSSIRRVWRQYLRPYEYKFVLKLATEEQVFKIVPAFLPDNESYRALEEFINRKFLENTRGEKAPKQLVREKTLLHLLNL